MVQVKVEECPEEGAGIEIQVHVTVVDQDAEKEAVEEAEKVEKGRGDWDGRIDLRDSKKLRLLRNGISSGGRSRMGCLEKSC